MLAVDLLNRYIREHPYGLADSTAEQLRCTFSAYVRFCRSSGLGVFDCEQANQWLDELRQTRAPDTCRTQRTNLLCVWWWAYREDLVPEPPLKLRKLRPIHRSPTAWTLAEVRQLLAAAEADRRRPLFWCSLIRAGYDSGLRLGNLLALPAAWFATKRVAMPQNVWQVTQLKTGRNVSVGFRPTTLEAIGMHLAGRTTGLVWPLWARREAFYRAFRHLVASAQIRPGTFRWLRRTAATQLERVAPGRATELLGHASRSTTEQFYLDRSQLHETPLPPW